MTKPVNKPMIISVRSIPLKTLFSRMTSSVGKTMKQTMGMVHPTMASTRTPSALACASSGVSAAHNSGCELRQERKHA